MMDLCVSKFKESEGLYVGPKEAGYCLLRSQLVMAFHDTASFRHLANEVCPSPAYISHYLHTQRLVYMFTYCIGTALLVNCYLIAVLDWLIHAFNGG